MTELNRQHLRNRAEDDALDARIASFELAYRMQMAATDAFDVEQEPQYVRDAYGPGVQARQLLIARRLIERGVRFVQLYHGDVQPWDSHDHIAENHRKLAQDCDQAIAALLADLKQRGLFEDTLVLCGGDTTELKNKNINVLLSTPFGALSPILRDSTEFFYKSSIATTFFALYFNTQRLSLDQRKAVRKLVTTAPS